MNSLDTLMGLNRQGIPEDMPMNAYDPMYELALQGDDRQLTEHMGVPYEDPYALVGAEPPIGMSNNELTRQALGQPVPQVSPQEIQQLAQALGLNQDNMVVGQHTDPMFTPQPDLMRLLGGY